MSADQKEIRTKVRALLARRRRVAKKIQSLRETERLARARISRRTAEKIDPLVTESDALFKEIEEAQRNCTHEFHFDTKQSGRCPDCNWYRPEDRNATDRAHP